VNIYTSALSNCPWVDQVCFHHFNSALRHKKGHWYRWKAIL